MQSGPSVQGKMWSQRTPECRPSLPTNLLQTRLKVYQLVACSFACDEPDQGRSSRLASCSLCRVPESLSQSLACQRALAVLHRAALPGHAHMCWSHTISHLKLRGPVLTLLHLPYDSDVAE